MMLLSLDADAHAETDDYGEAADVGTIVDERNLAYVIYTSGSTGRPQTERRLYDLFDINLASVVTLAVSLNTRLFFLEILGINLGIEATGVGGSYIESWKATESMGSKWLALRFRLHNSIDNYANGHTKWSLAAVQSYLRRVKDTAPAAVAPHWQRIWRLWRFQDLITHGAPSERSALAEHFEVTTLAPT